MRLMYLPLIVLIYLLSLTSAFAKDSKEIQEQRRTAQKERQEKKNGRNAEIRDATNVFREFFRDIKPDYQDRVKAFDTDFELKRVELRADRDTKIAAAEAEYQKQIMGLFMNPDAGSNEAAIKNLETQGKAYSDELFRLQKAAAETIHKARMANEKRKSDEWQKRDDEAMAKAAELGLTAPIPPILATPIGDGLTKSEQAWNEREQKEVARLEKQNQRTVSEFVYGAKLRAWEMKNLDEDFELKWREKGELHALNAQQVLYNSILGRAAQGGEIDRQAFFDRLSELGQKNKQIKIEYKKIRDQNRIKRREERKKIVGR